MTKINKQKVIPYGKQYIDQEDIKSVVEVLKSDFITQGPKVKDFAEGLIKKFNCKYAVPTNSATSALQISYLALGLSKNDILWTSPNTFVATTNAALHCGAKVDFIDIDPLTYNIDVNKLKEKLKIAEINNSLPKIITCVHFGGQSCPMKEIHNLSLIYKFKIVEDASHAVGSFYKNYPVGSCKFSDISVLSFHPVKIITTGEGGVATTNDPILSENLKILVTHGIKKLNPNLVDYENDEIWNYEQISLGFNFRITDIQAALGLSQLNKLEKFVKKRNLIAKKYYQSFQDLPIKTPFVDEENLSSFHLYTIRIPLKNTYKDRNSLYKLLLNERILVNLHYIPVYRHPYYQKMGFQKNYCPEAELYFKEAMSLPIFPSLSEKEQDRVIQEITKFFN